MPTRPANDDPKRADTAEKNGRTNRGPRAWTLLDTTDNMVLLRSITLMTTFDYSVCFSFDVIWSSKEKRQTFVPPFLALNDAS
mmetsp:Transcript_61124/g.149639  ORF Transcript_61124/g.149639 Transcript_61124/m.149639 type:complete len:83 (-) Transcript_61124:168-416(-)